MPVGTKSALYGLSTRRMLGLVDLNGSDSGGAVGVKILSYSGKRWIKILVDGKIIEVDERYVSHQDGRSFSHKELSCLKTHRHLRRTNVLVKDGRVFLRNVNPDVFPWAYEVVREAPSDAIDHNRHCDYEDEASKYFNLLKN